MKKSIVIMAGAIASCAIVTATTAVAGSTFTVEVEKKFSSWSAVLYNNVNGNRLFCAMESENKNTTIRVVRYIENGDTFMELFNPNWRLLSGQSKFRLKFIKNNKNLEADFSGKREATAYTYDFNDVEMYEAVTALIGSGARIEAKNSNGSPIATFGGSGSEAALQAYKSCLAGEFKK